MKKMSHQDRTTTTIQTKLPIHPNGPSNTSESPELVATSSTDLDIEFIDKETFSQAVVYHKSFYKSSLIDAIFAVAERVGLDPEHDAAMIGGLVDHTLIQRLTVECIENKTIKVEATSSLDC